MRTHLRFVIALALAAPVAAQFARFECQVVGSTFPPIAGPADCEGITADGPPWAPSVVASWPASAEFPTEGARFARLQAWASVDRPPGVVATRPLPPGTTDVRIPIPAGSIRVAFDYQWFNEETSPSFNDGFDFSICDSTGARLEQCAWGDTATLPAPTTGRLTFEAKTSPTPAGAYLSCAVFNGGDTCCGGNILFVDDVRFARDALSFDADLPGPVLPGGTSEDVTARTAGTAIAEVVATPVGAFPVHGARYLDLSSFGCIDIPGFGQIPRPVPADVTEAVIRIPVGATTVSFAYGFVNAEPGGPSPFNDGFDVSVCDAAGLRLFGLAYGDTYSIPGFGFNGPYRFRGVLPPLPAGAVLSAVVFNGADCRAGSRLFLDDVWFVSRPRLSYSSPLGPSTIAMRIEYGLPGGVYFVPMTLVQGESPCGWFYGLDISFAELIAEALAGPPFLGFYDEGGRSTFGPVAVPFPGLTVFGVPLDDLWTYAPRSGDPIRYQIP